MLHHAAGEYIEMPGFTEDLSECRTESELPDAAREYLRFVADFVGVPIVLVGVGPGREQVVWTEDADDVAIGATDGRGRELIPAPYEHHLEAPALEQIFVGHLAHHPRRHAHDHARGRGRRARRPRRPR